MSFLYNVFALLYRWHILAANSDTLFNESKEKILALFDGVFLDIVFGRGSLLKASESEIKSVFSSYEDVGVNVQLVERKAVLNGRIAPAKQEYKRNSHEQYDSTLSSRLKVNIHAGRLPLPKGVLTILDLYTKSIQPIQKIDKQSEKK